MPIFLHLGSGPKRKAMAGPGFQGPDWQEVRLDNDPAFNPDFVANVTDMSVVASDSVDAIFSSHNLEHLFPHEVPRALAEFMRVLKPDGTAVIVCPDLLAACELVAQDKLTEPAYTAKAGPVSPLDIIYGPRAALAAGHLGMARRCGFTPKVLAGSLKRAGFTTVGVIQRKTVFDLWALASRKRMDEQEFRNLAKMHVPVVPMAPAKENA
jgi:ubiquinone/menaquinone biosynthesis C-methylase UbiE